MFFNKLSNKFTSCFETNSYFSDQSDASSSEPKTPQKGEQPSGETAGYDGPHFWYETGPEWSGPRKNRKPIPTEWYNRK